MCHPDEQIDSLNAADLAEKADNDVLSMQSQVGADVRSPVETLDVHRVVNDYLWNALGLGIAGRIFRDSSDHFGEPDERSGSLDHHVIVGDHRNAENSGGKYF